MAQCKRKRGAAAHDVSTSDFQKPITAFAVVGKAHHGLNSVKKRKTVHADAQDIVPSLARNKDKKRKRVDAEDDSIAVKASSDTNQVTQEPEAPATPTSKRTRREQPVLPETPSRGAAALFDKLKIKPQVCRLDAVPEECLELQALFSAFLSALSLHYSHNGTASPVNVKVLLPTITKHWRKRSVTLDDLRHVLAIARDGHETFSLQDYGRAGICLVRGQPRGRTLQRASSYIDEATLNADFETALASLWHDWKQRLDQENCDVATFLAQRSLEPIVANEATQKAAPLFARGQQRLADIKAAAAASAATKPATTAPSASSPPPTTKTTQTRTTALLDRILAKQTHLANLPAGPSKAQLARRAALHRIEDVSRALALLAGGKPAQRCSFSLAVVAQRLQQSLRNPIARDEVERCLELMAREVTPGFVTVVAMGAAATAGTGDAKGVVVARACAVEVGELRRRVEVALARED